MDGSMNLLEQVGDATPPVAEPNTFTQPEPTILRLTAEHQHEAADRGVTVKCGYIYVIEAVGLNRFMIGMSVDIKGRFPAYRTECPVNCHPLFIAVVPLESVKKIERKLHDLFGHRRVKGEWFDLTAEDLAQMPESIKKATRPHLGMITRKIRAQGRCVMHPETAKAEQPMRYR